MRLLRHNSIDPWHEVDRLFGSFRGDSGWLPAFDVEETDSAYVLRGDIPGIAQKDIQVRIDEGVLSVSGERQTVASDEGRRRFSRREPAGAGSRGGSGCRTRSTRTVSRRRTTMALSSSRCRSASPRTPPA